MVGKGAAMVQYAGTLDAKRDFDPLDRPCRVRSVTHCWRERPRHQERGGGVDCLDTFTYTFDAGLLRGLTSEDFWDVRENTQCGKGCTDASAEGIGSDLAPGDDVVCWRPTKGVSSQTSDEFAWYRCPNPTCIKLRDPSSELIGPNPDALGLLFAGSVLIALSGAMAVGARRCIPRHVTPSVVQPSVSEMVIAPDALGSRAGAVGAPLPPFLSEPLRNDALSTEQPRHPRAWEGLC
uniref:Uncharacterized protein n=1 Tax=Hemiselmis andersenii TaxID=464988 RepID=A0A6T8KA17_HEMAN|mmetsp:Transcript_41571/g.101481  ORF Transcript_41571/g.101481 Transcript_41571/m.101481 type:complete len:236 (+) Transcript_41571:391-1098(+)